MQTQLLGSQGIKYPNLLNFKQKEISLVLLAIALYGKIKTQFLQQ